MTPTPPRIFYVRAMLNYKKTVLFVQSITEFPGFLNSIGKYFFSAALYPEPFLSCGCQCLLCSEISLLQGISVPFFPRVLTERCPLLHAGKPNTALDHEVLFCHAIHLLTKIISTEDTTSTAASGDLLLFKNLKLEGPNA
jgi:hypothetical protein